MVSRKRRLLYLLPTSACATVNGSVCCQRIASVVPYRRLATAPVPVRKALLRRLMVEARRTRQRREGLRVAEEALSATLWDIEAEIRLAPLDIPEH